MRTPCLIALILICCGYSFADTFNEEWKDPKRGRVVPVKIYLPSNTSREQPAPIVIFSHGLGGSRENYGYLGEYWSAHGYVAVHLQHAGSDDSVWRNAEGTDRATNLVQAANFANYVERVRDVTFAIDRLTELNNAKVGALAGKLDLERIAMAGHSFGAYTTQAIAGQVLSIGTRERSFYDSRVKCAIALSPSPPRDDAQRDKAFAKIGMPVFYLTGTKDSVIIQPIQPIERRVPYDKTDAKDQYLLTFNGADHMTFTGRGTATEFCPMIQKATTAFLDAYLKQDEKSRDYLRKTLNTDLKENGKLEWK